VPKNEMVLVLKQQMEKNELAENDMTGRQEF
jgi:hypothetical protein